MCKKIFFRVIFTINLQSFFFEKEEKESFSLFLFFVACDLRKIFLVWIIFFFHRLFLKISKKKVNNKQRFERRQKKLEMWINNNKSFYFRPTTGKRQKRVFNENKKKYSKSQSKWRRKRRILCMHFQSVISYQFCCSECVVVVVGKAEALKNCFSLSIRKRRF